MPSVRKSYDEELLQLDTLLARMGHEAGAAIESALTALRNDDIELARSVVARDSQIDASEHEIEHRCLQLLLRQQPVAGDLRHISTAMKVVTDIERMGDHASDIAEIIPHLVTVRKERDPAVSQAIAMGRKAYQMIIDAMDALTAEDEIAARRVIAADDAVDYDFNTIKRMLAAEIAADPAQRMRWQTSAGVDPETAPFVLRTIRQDYGSAESYLEAEYGLTPARLMRLRRMYLE